MSAYEYINIFDVGDVGVYSAEQEYTFDTHWMTRNGSWMRWEDCGEEHLTNVCKALCVGHWRDGLGTLMPDMDRYIALKRAALELDRRPGYRVVLDDKDDGSRDRVVEVSIIRQHSTTLYYRGRFNLCQS